MQEDIETILKRLDDEMVSISAIVGSGASVASGLKTFRGEDGYYRGKDPQDLASTRGFKNDPELVWSWYRERIKMAFEAEPNPIHNSLVDLEHAGLLNKVITQNVDGLHRRAGQSPSHLIEIHGTISKTHCFDNCGRSNILDTVPNNIPVECECGGLQRPSVVWFGESLDFDDIQKAEDALQKSNILLIIGTSGIVRPVSMMPMIAKRSGAILIEFNIEPTAYHRIDDYFYQGPAEETVPELVNYLIERNSE